MKLEKLLFYKKIHVVRVIYYMKNDDNIDHIIFFSILNIVLIK